MPMLNRSGQSEIAQAGVQAGMSYYINNTMSIGSDPFAPDGASEVARTAGRNVNHRAMKLPAVCGSGIIK